MIPLSPNPEWPSSTMLPPPSAAFAGLILMLMAWICNHAALPALAQQCSGSFSTSCSGEVLLGGGYTLSASCLDEYGNYEDTSLDLDEHIVNSDGVLACSRSGGSFSQTCSSIALFGSSQLSASCLDVSSIPQSTSLDLNACVQNNNGELQWACFSS